MTDQPGGDARAAPSTPSEPGAVATEADDTTIIGGPRDGALRPLFGAVAALFIAFPIVNLISTSAEPLESVLVVIATAVFAGLMLWNTRFPHVTGERSGATPVVRWPAPPSVRRIALSTAAVVVLLVIATVLSLSYPDAGWFALFYYASTGASTIRSTQVAVALMVAAGVMAGLSLLAVEHNLGNAIVQGLSVTIIGLTVFSAIAVRRTNRALVAARHELARLAVADERSRIARDLHDTLGHSLSVITLKSELAGRLVDEDPARAKAEMADVERVARESLAAVRETIGGFRQPSLAAELAGARTALAAAGIEGRVEPAPEGIPPAADAVLGWAVREGVTNVVRHGRSRTATIRVDVTDRTAAVDIQNDRVPGDRGDRSSPGVETAAGSGLDGLRERVAIVGGEVEAGPLAEGGFRLRVSVPIA